MLCAVKSRWRLRRSARLTCADLAVWLVAALASPAAVAADTPLTVVLGKATSQFSIAAEIPCPPEDICMDAWIGWNIVVDEVLSGGPIKGRIRAARVQHAQFVPGYLRRFELFVLEPIADPELRRVLNADYMLKDFAESTAFFCTHEAPDALGIPAKTVFREQGTANPRYCFLREEVEENSSN